MSEDERPLRLLSLDGGGIRGLSSLYVLRSIMAAVQKEGFDENATALRPCDYFDMIAGTSTGGLIAVMLGVLQMDIQTCIDAYLRLAPEIFPSQGLISETKFGKIKKAALGNYRFQAAPLEAAIKRLVKDHLGDGASGNEMMRHQSGQKARVFVCVTSEKPRVPFRFRNYNSARGLFEDVTIWQACRATSAAPTFFPPIVIGNPPVPYVDGGLGYNNPVRALLDEAGHVWPSKKIGCIVSVGTGVASMRDVGTSVGLLKTLSDMATDTEQVANEVKEEMKHHRTSGEVYFRFNVQHGLEEVGLEEWQEMGRVKTATEAYLQKKHRKVELCASQLVTASHSIQSISSPTLTQAYSNIPFPRDENFVGREDTLAQIDDEHANAKTRRWASLYGLGGIGKSQIAIEYSCRLRLRSSHISTFWVHAGSKARFEHSYTEIATTVGITGSDDSKVNILAVVSRWLASSINGPWLLILDNADDASVLLNVPTKTPTDETEPMQRRLLEFIPRVKHGSVLITTRNRSCALELNNYCGTPIEVQALKSQESLDLLRTRIPNVAEDEAMELVEELENVPLAVTQAAAYIREVSQISVSLYIAELRRKGADQAALLNKGKHDLRRDGGVPNAVMSSWELSFIQIREQSPKSAELLSLMSYFHRQSIPDSLLKSDNEDASFLEDISPLINFSLIKAEIGGTSYEMHRLIQIAMRYWLHREGSDQMWKEVAIQRVAARFPEQDHYINSHICEAIMPHADEVLDHTIMSGDKLPPRVLVLLKTATHLLFGRRDFKLAEQRSRASLQILRQHYDEDSDEVLPALYLLASACRELSNFEEARVIYQTVLERRLRNGRAEDPTTLTVMQDLAMIYSAIGQYQKAEDLLKPVIEVNERLFGPDCEETLEPNNVLAAIMLAQKRYEEAEKLLAANLKVSRAFYGKEHVFILDAMHSLVRVYFSQYRLDEAESLCTEVITQSTNVLGESHRTTISARSSLAIIYHRQGRLDEAQEVCERCLDTAISVNLYLFDTVLDLQSTLASTFEAQGRLLDAVRLLEGVVKTSPKVLAANHFIHPSDRLNLAHCYYKLGNKSQAIQQLEEAIRYPTYILPAQVGYLARILAIWKSE